MLNRTPYKVLFICGNARSLIANRGDLISKIKNLGHEVFAIIPSYDFLPDIELLDIEYCLINLNRMSMNPLTDFIFFYQLLNKINSISPDIVFSYTLKPVIYGSIAARILNVPTIASLITGLGFLYSGVSYKQILGRFFSNMLYKASLPKNDIVFFQNPDDLKLFKNFKLLGKYQSVVLLNGSGVNLKEFTPIDIPKGPQQFILIARLLKSKGIHEFVAAASRIKQDCPLVNFHIIGPHDLNLPGALKQKEINYLKSLKCVEFHSAVKDVRPFLANCTVFVLPSSYREGVPRTILEAMATGRPIITTDTPGCREAVINNKNGFLIPVRDVDALDKAMRCFINNPNLAKTMGAESRKIAEQKYDVNNINELIIKHLNLYYN